VVQKYGVEVDICPDCKGVWLDRGELEKIVGMLESGGPALSADSERTVGYRPEDRPREDYREPRREEHRYEDRDYDSDRRHEKHYDERGREIDPRTGKPRKKRESWLGEIFDVFD
jgi:Zn-finger nucleic acid-binding protein